MLYKVTPAMPAPSAPSPLGARGPASAKAAKEPRKRRTSAVFDADGREVLITMMCLKCRAMKPLSMFGLRRMADGAIRNQPWCRPCRSGASPKKRQAAGAEASVESTEALDGAESTESAHSGAGATEDAALSTSVETAVAPEVPLTATTAAPAGVLGGFAPRPSV